MTFPTDWDVNKYRVEHESEDHWELRRRFLLEHKDKFPEERLVCLAQVFYNVEFYGCRYPEKTMRLVADLSRGVADDHREKMKTKLQRTFVQASDAASTKVKGRSGIEGTAPKTFKPINFQKADEENPVEMVTLDGLITEDKSQGSNTLPESNKEKTADNQAKPSEKPTKKKKKRSKKKKANLNPSDTSDSIPGRFVLADQSRFEIPNPYKRPSDDIPAGLEKRLKTGGKSTLSRLVLMESAGMNPYGILSRSTGASHMNLKQDNRKTAGGTEVVLYIESEELSRATAPTVEEAKAKCAAEGLAKLKKQCYTLVVKDRLAGSVVDKTDISTTNTPQGSDTPDHLAEDSKANRMMKLMGWGGKGLGKDQQGREEPVQVAQRIKRAGLGSNEPSSAEFRKTMTEMLKKFKIGGDNGDLVFASDFSKDERAAIHIIAKRFNLKSLSYGKDENRQLVVSRKKTPLEIVREVQDAGGSTDKYDLKPPDNN